MRHTTETNKGRKYDVYTFDTLSDFLDRLQPRRDGQARTNPASWAGSESYEEALALARNGWPEGLDLVRPIVDRVVRDAIRWVEEPSTKPDIEGVYFDPGLVAQGIPECCYAPDPENPQPSFRPTVKLVCNFTASAAVNANTLRKRGAAFMALALALDALGVKNELWATETTNNDNHEIRILIKAEGESLQYDKAAFVFIHPSMLRRLAFAFQETIGEPCTYFNYGMPADTFMPADFILQGNGAALGHVAIEELDAWVLAQVERFIKGEAL